MKLAIYCGMSRYYIDHIYIPYFKEFSAGTSEKLLYMSLLAPVRPVEYICKYFISFSSSKINIFIIDRRECDRNRNESPIKLVHSPESEFLGKQADEVLETHL